MTIYRAVPSEVDEIRPGDWVALDRSYASLHKRNQSSRGWKILSKKVPLEDVVWAGTDENEFFYSPKEYQSHPAITTHESLVRHAIHKGYKIPEEVLSDYPDLVEKSSRVSSVVRLIQGGNGGRK